MQLKSETKFSGLVVATVTIIGLFFQFILISETNMFTRNALPNETLKRSAFRNSESIITYATEPHIDSPITSPLIVEPGVEEVDNSFSSSPCDTEYERVTDGRLDGLTNEDLRRSWPYIGNRKRIAGLAETLRNMNNNPRPINAVVTGGSITLGHGVVGGRRYSDQLETWINDKYPIPEDVGKHTILNRGSHGADICAMAKRLTILIEELPKELDLFIIEFSVNDYQGQDHEVMVVDIEDVFFDGFENIAICTEFVVRRLLKQYPTAAIMFLEMRTAILPRKTASLLHIGAAQHYQVPVIDYSEVFLPDYHLLLEKLKPYNFSTAIGDTVLPYPHGCHPCKYDDIVDFFHESSCVHLCDVDRYLLPDNVDDCTPQKGREHCHVPFFAHDEVHPSGVGHHVVSDLIINAIATTGRDVCNGEIFEQDVVIPQIGWMVRDAEALDARNDYFMVNDTYFIFVDGQPLVASAHTDGFTLLEDRFERYGWIATNEDGGETVTFDIKFPTEESGCYIPVLSYLKSYENMGSFTVTVTDLSPDNNRITNVDVDGLWSPHISIPNDIQLLKDGDFGCTGNCQIKITTHPKHPDRGGNKVKIITLAVRRCLSDELL